MYGLMAIDDFGIF